MPQPQTRLEYHHSALVDLWCLVRARVAGGGEAPALEGLAEAVAAARELEQSVGLPPAWGLLEGNLVACADAAALVKAFEALPEKLERPPAPARPLRAPALKLAQALQSVEGAFQEQLWPQRRQALEAALASLQAGLGAHAAQCFADVTAAFGMRDPGTPIPVYLVTEEPPPGAHTIRTRGGTASFVSIHKVEGSLLAEMVLHEAIHALDSATGDQDTVLVDLRGRLEQAGVLPNSPVMRDLPHILMFAQAADTIRRVLDPAHRPYAEVSGVYERIGPRSQAVVDAWGAHREGKINRDEALDRIVAQAGAGGG